jgi:hypothetical protein
MSWKLALVLSVFGLALAAQPALEGTVTDPLKHSGIAGVSVRLTLSNHEERETTTDESGRFSFNDLPVDAYTVILGKEGYIPADGSDELPGRLPVVRPGTEPVNLEMLPLSELRGRVLHSDGTPAAGIELVLERAKFTQQTAKSGDDGAFVFDVGPGSYYLLARPNSTSPTKQSVTETATYYPGAADLSQAEEIIVGAGSAVSGIDIHLRSTPLYRLRGVVVNDSRERVKATVELRRKNSSDSAAWLLISRGTRVGGGETISIYARPDSTGVSESYSSAVSDDGRFSFSVPEGEWIVHADGTPTEISADGKLVGDVAVVVPSERQESLEVPLEPTFDLKAIAELEGERDGHWFDPPLILRSAEVVRPLVWGSDDSILDLSTPADLGGKPKKSIRFTQVRAESYSVLPSPALMTGVYLVGFSVDGRDVMNRTFQLSAATTDLRAVFRRAQGGLQGRTEKGEPAAILIIPISDSANSAIICIDSPKERQFSVPALTPGDYTVVAVDKVDALRFSDTATRAALVTLGTRIKIEDAILNLTIPVHRWPE